MSTTQPDPDAPRCNPSRFERTSDGFTWIVGDAALAFRNTEQTAEAYTYNYRRRTARVELVDDPSIFLETSAYTETDCNAPPGPDGSELWCLVSHGLVGEESLQPLVEAHRPCESGLELLEALAVQSSAPTAFRVAIPTYAGALYEKLGELEVDMVADGIPRETIDAIDAHAKASEDADKGYARPEDDAKSAAALRQARTLLAPLVHLPSAWKADLVAQRALARLERRYPTTFVGPEETFYDVVDPQTDPVTIDRTPAPWSGE